MRVRTQRSLARVLLPLLAAALFAAGLVPAAHAAAYTYSTQQRTVNAGILLVDDAASNDFDGPVSPGAGVSNPDPYIFYIFNQRSDLKPFGWNVVNPLAPPTVTSDILNRWNYRPNIPAYAYQLNEPITPDMAPYWEVSLSKTTLANMLQYDVLLLNLGGGHVTNFTDDEVHKLRRYVDAGGQLLIEGTSGNINPTNGLFFAAQFNGGGSRPYLVPATNTTLLRHPIIASPYLLSQQELNALGPVSQSQTAAATNTLFNTVLKSSATGTAAALVAGQYGAGEVVIDATGSLAALNDAVPGISSGYGTSFGYGGASNSGPRCEGPFTAAPASDLKLLADILAWTGAHPNEHKNGHQSSQSPAVVGPAVSATWNYTLPANANNAFAPGAVINGGFVYVRDAAGYLRAFNATPGTDILGTGDPDAGFQDYDLGKPADEIWSTNGERFPGAAAPAAFQDLYASAPTVASFGGVTFVMVEDRTGIVHLYNATDGTAPASPIPATIGTAQTPYTLNNGPAPAPTFFEGRIYAGQPNGTLFVYDLVPGRKASSPGVYVPLGAAATVGAVVAPPTVGIVRQSLSGLNGVGSAYSDDIIAAVTTATSIYTVELGSRHDPLAGGGPNYSIHSAGVGNFTMDAAALPYAYNITANGYLNQVFSPPTTGTTFTIAPSAATPPPFYANYDVDFADANTQATQALPAYVLNRAQFAFEPTATNGAQQVSAPALGANGNLYYTVNYGGDSTLVCAHDTRNQGNPQAQMLWRFRLPTTLDTNNGAIGILDADGVSYNNLAGYQFFGAPVVDRNDNVFALATDGTRIAVLCFRGDQRVTAQITAAGTGNASVNSVTQPVPITGTTGSEYGSTTPPLPATAPNQYGATVDNNGVITLLSFGALSPTGNTRPIIPNLAEPEPVSVVYTVGGAANGGTPTPALLHTNMLWYTILPTTAVSVGSGTALTIYTALPNLSTLAAPTSGLTLVGNYLYYGDSAGNLVRVDAYPQNASLVSNRYAALSSSYMPNATPPQSPPANPTATTDSGRATVAYVQTGVGAIGGVPSAGNGVLIVNGTGNTTGVNASPAGVAAFGSQNTLVADANRVVELDADGLATWAVDATTLIGTNNVATHLELNHPSAVTQVASNDYLVADTGNNRCVRFDRSGNVLWELTRLNDAPLTGANIPASLVKSNRLLAPGEPTTLSHPVSVDSYADNSVQDTFNGGNYTIQHYLIADTGHYRVLDVVDVFNGLGAPVLSHNLFWVSHTYDVQHRLYSYTGANYYYSYTSGQRYVAALISNVRVAPLTGTTVTQAALPVGVLSPATSDAPGATLALLDYDPSGLHPAQKDGYIGVGNLNASGTPQNQLRAFSSFTAMLTAPLSAGGQFALTEDEFGNSLGGAAQTGTAQTLYLRNPRYLQTYTTNKTSGVTHFLLADDNGVFDLTPNTVAGPPLQAVWGFTQGDYYNINTPIDAATFVGNPNSMPPVPPGFLRTRNVFLGTQNIPFIPTSMARSSADMVGGYVFGHYLVTNGYSQGQVTPGTVGQVAPGQTSTTGGEVLELHAVVNGGALQTQEIHGSTGPFNGTTLGKPSNTRPLSQPAFAAREK